LLALRGAPLTVRSLTAPIAHYRHLSEKPGTMWPVG
jgi:hypothetical protein